MVNFISLPVAKIQIPSGILFSNSQVVWKCVTLKKEICDAKKQSKNTCCFWTKHKTGTHTSLEKAHVRACFENFNFKLESKSMHASFACLMFFAPSFQNKISERWKAKIYWGTLSLKNAICGALSVTQQISNPWEPDKIYGHPLSTDTFWSIVSQAVCMVTVDILAWKCTIAALLERKAGLWLT